MSFEQRKKDILEKEDKSSIGEWDAHIVSLCEKINSLDNYYTTSSCSGRIVVIRDLDKKRPGLFEFVSHEIIAPLGVFQSTKFRDNFEVKDNLKFKSEPPILHVACREIEDAKSLIEKAQNCGWKRSGIISLGKNIIVELLSTEKLEFPIVCEGKILVSDEFLSIVIQKSNENLRKGWQKIDNLAKSLG